MRPLYPEVFIYERQERGLGKNVAHFSFRWRWQGKLFRFLIRKTLNSHRYYTMMY